MSPYPPRPSRPDASELLDDFLHEHREDQRAGRTMQSLYEKVSKIDEWKDEVISKINGHLVDDAAHFAEIKAQLQRDAEVRISSHQPQPAPAVPRRISWYARQPAREIIRYAALAAICSALGWSSRYCGMPVMVPVFPESAHTVGVEHKQ